MNGNVSTNTTEKPCSWQQKDDDGEQQQEEKLRRKIR